MSDAWSPPFVGNECCHLECPKCQGSVCVRDEERYVDGDTVEAYCAACHADLEVTACVDITFSDVEIAP